MKITTEHYKTLEIACNSILGTLNLYEEYKKAGLSDMRFNWDVLYASTINGMPSGTWVSQNLYPYLNDSHINSALARIMGNSGTDSKGKR